MIQGKPLYEGPAGKAWEMVLEKLRMGQTGKDAGIAVWLIHCPSAHPWWSYYSLCLFHLRPLEGQPPAKIYLAGASYEITLFAMSPDWTSSIEDPRYFQNRLEPINFGAQFCASSDFEAKSFVLRSVVDVVEGCLNPDTDAIQQWVARFGDNMLKK